MPRIAPQEEEILFESNISDNSDQIYTRFVWLRKQLC